MALYIETVLKYEKLSESGVMKKVSEHYLVDALSFTEAEARIVEEMTPMISGEFSVSAVKKTKISEVFFDETADRSYMVKVAFVTLDERTGVEKKVANFILVQADSFDDAVINFKEGMKGTMADYEIISIAESPILEVFKLELGDKKA